MNLVDIIDPNSGLQQDVWTLSSPIFGKDDQLKVIGWSGKRGGNKLYIVKCSQCCSDFELFGEGYFKRPKQDLVEGKIPCGCSSYTRWSKEQYTLLCTRCADDIGCTFLGYLGQWKGAFTKIRLLCEKHGEWDSGIISTLIYKGVGCRPCAIERMRESNTKSDDVMIASFFDSEAFHADTKFWRSTKKDIRGHSVYWHYYCPECGGEGESSSSMLQKGCRSCLCSSQRPTEAYINTIVDEDVIAIKFGVTRDSRQRLGRQKLKSVYAIYQHSVYRFTDITSCRKAEKECKQELECGIVLKRDMEDGYTETTWPYNLEKIVEIYERNGGVKVD